jgi:hypothetical protein
LKTKRPTSSHPNRRQDAQVHQPAFGHPLELGDLRVVGGHQHRVVEHLVQPGAHFLQAAEVEAPVVLVQPVGREYEAEGERLAVQLLAV